MNDSVFFTNFAHLCVARGKTPTRVATELGFSRSTVQRWRTMDAPRPATVQKLADYFGVTPGDLTGDTVPHTASNFWANYVKQCNLSGQSPTAVAQAIGLTNASISHWRTGTMPRPSTVQKLADYFGISPDLLTSPPTDTNLGNDAPPPAPQTAEQWEETLRNCSLSELLEIQAILSGQLQDKIKSAGLDTQTGNASDVE